MIEQLQGQASVDEAALSVCHYGRKILTCLQAYGVSFSFCRFFILKDEQRVAFLMLQNSTLLMSTQDDFPASSPAFAELSLFAQMHQPFRVEGSQTLLTRMELSAYHRLRRSIFRLVPTEPSAQFRVEQIQREPRLDDVYSILTEGFPNLTEHGLWLTDTSHMVRRGLRRCYTYWNTTAATAVYDYHNQVLVGQVATRAAARGKGYARDFLHWLAGDLQAQGKTSILYALDLRAGFYREIGFPLLGTEWVWERLDAEPNAKQKEEL